MLTKFSNIMKLVVQVSEWFLLLALLASYTF